MTAYFPVIYPDELLYSQLARYYAASGYMAYTFASEELFLSKTVRPDIEFLNSYTPAAKEAITRDMPMGKVVEKHTMFPYYGRFLPKERRQKAFGTLVSMTGNYHNLLPMPQRKDSRARCLRYCPLCAMQDREQYGETYWHRIHQMIGAHVCATHRCRLMDSDAIISGKSPPSFKTAEEIIPLLESYAFSDNEMECAVAAYMAEVFQSDIDMESSVPVGAYLHSRMANTMYRSIRGEQRNIALFHADFLEFYKDLGDNWFAELWQVQKVLTGDRVNFYEICLMAMFLRITSEELVRIELPAKTQQQLFDEKVFRLHDQGWKYPDIAKALNAPYETVKAIGGRRYGTYHKPPKTPLKSGAKPRDWQRIDEETLPLVKDAIRQLQGDGSTRPKRVTTSAIEKMLGIVTK